MMQVVASRVGWLGSRVLGMTLTVVLALGGLAAVPSAAQQGPASVTMIVADPSALGSGDAAIRDRLSGLGFDITLVDDDSASAGSATGASFVLISSTAKSYVVGATFRNTSIPV